VGAETLREEGDVAARRKTEARFRRLPVEQLDQRRKEVDPDAGRRRNGAPRTRIDFEEGKASPFVAHIVGLRETCPLDGFHEGAERLHELRVIAGTQPDRRARLVW